MRGSIARALGLTIVLVFVPICVHADDAASDPIPDPTPVPSTLELHLQPTLHLGEPSTPGNGLAAADAFAPMRLSLLSGIFSIGKNLDPDCAEHAEASGNTLNHFALQRAFFLRLTPQLTLNGFSHTGCAGDSGAGGGITFMTPLKSNFWLITSAGAYAVPRVGFIPARINSDLRVDIVMKNEAGRTLTVGLGAGGRSEGNAGSHVGGLRFGGSF